MPFQLNKFWEHPQALKEMSLSEFTQLILRSRLKPRKAAERGAKSLLNLTLEQLQLPQSGSAEVILYQVMTICGFSMFKNVLLNSYLNYSTMRQYFHALERMTIDEPLLFDADHVINYGEQ